MRSLRVRTRSDVRARGPQTSGSPSPDQRAGADPSRASTVNPKRRHPARAPRADEVGPSVHAGGRAISLPRHRRPSAAQRLPLGMSLGISAMGGLQEAAEEPGASGDAFPPYAWEPTPTQKERRHGRPETWAQRTNEGPSTHLGCWASRGSDLCLRSGDRGDGRSVGRSAFWSVGRLIGRSSSSRSVKQSDGRFWGTKARGPLGSDRNEGPERSEAEKHECASGCPSADSALPSPVCPEPHASSGSKYGVVRPIQRLRECMNVFMHVCVSACMFVLSLRRMTVAM